MVFFNKNKHDGQSIRIQKDKYNNDGDDDDDSLIKLKRQRRRNENIENNDNNIGNTDTIGDGNIIIVNNEIENNVDNKNNNDDNDHHIENNNNNNNNEQSIKNLKNLPYYVHGNYPIISRSTSTKLPPPSDRTLTIMWYIIWSAIFGHHRDNSLR